MVTTTPPTSTSAVWQGTTQDGHTLRLTRSGLAKIEMDLHRSGLHHLVQRNLNGNREVAVIRAISKVVSHATRSKSSQTAQVFSAIGKTRTYEIVTQPIGQQQSVIRLMRSLPLKLEHEFEGKFEYEYESELWNESEGFNAPKRSRSPARPHASTGSKQSHPREKPLQRRSSTGSTSNQQSNMRVSQTRAGAMVISFVDETNQTQVFNVLRNLVKEDALKGNRRIIYVISGTHGNRDGTVDSTIRDINFKYEDLDSARITRNNINIRDYHQTAPNRWKDLSNKGKNVVHVLAWCHSFKWITNHGPKGNDGKLVMR